MMRVVMMFLLVCLTFEASADAAPRRGRYRRSTGNSTVSQAAPQPVRQATWVESATSAPAVVQGAGVVENGANDALAEVNAARARRGLRPFQHDPLLTQAAQACARARASRRIAGHLSNDFAYLPAGATAKAAGCGALEPSWGWGTCCTYDNYTYAGAAMVMGADGKRYMHLFVR